MLVLLKVETPKPLPVCEIAPRGELRVGQWTIAVGRAFESPRPNVTVDAAGLCIKAGNAVLLRGGSEAMNSNHALVKVIAQAAYTAGLPHGAIGFIGTTDRQAVNDMIKLDELVDLLIPRGGEEMIRHIREHATVPVLSHGKGLCHTYIDKDADMEKAVKIAVNAKCQRPGVCNAMETLLVDGKIAKTFLPTIVQRLGEKNVQLRVDADAEAILKSEVRSPKSEVRRATEQDFYTEYNDYILNVRVVDGVKAAIDHINQYGSAHSDSIVTKNEAHAKQFLAEVDSAAVYWNASTRFTDGGEFGMGAEIGISTDKIGARGPMGLDELTSYKWLGIGSGQVRT